MEFNSITYGTLHKVETKKGKFGDYFLVTIRHQETFKELRFPCYEQLDWVNNGIRQGDEVSLSLLLEERGYNFSAKIVQIEKAS